MLLVQSQGCCSLACKADLGTVDTRATVYGRGHNEELIRTLNIIIKSRYSITVCELTVKSGGFFLHCM